MAEKEERKVTYKKEKKPDPKFAQISIPEREKRSGSEKMLEDIESFHRVEVEKTLPTTPVNIICAHCKDRVGYIIPKECKVPLTGDMVKAHPGCEGWPLPGPHQGPLEFVCPHAWGIDGAGDQHLFVFFREGMHNEADTFLRDDFTEFQIKDVPEIRYCVCGCGEMLEPDRENYTGLECYKRHMMELHGEDPIPIPEDLCPCGCGEEVGEGNKYADRLNCYRRHKAILDAEG